MPPSSTCSRRRSAHAPRHKFQGIAAPEPIVSHASHPTRFVRRDPLRAGDSWAAGSMRTSNATKIGRAFAVTATIWRSRSPSGRGGWAPGVRSADPVAGIWNLARLHVRADLVGVVPPPPTPASLLADVAPRSNTMTSSSPRPTAATARTVPRTGRRCPRNIVLSVFGSTRACCAKLAPCPTPEDAIFDPARRGPRATARHAP
jgi:hypothetical protein